MSAHLPGIGEWYRVEGGDIFEVVAVDSDDRSVEVQYFDGTVEEIDLDDWNAQTSTGVIVGTEAPEDWSGSVDVESEREESGYGGYENDRRLNASSLDGIDLFE
ncbi:MAG TPA: DUF6763 family protein [Steroidobacteraceae bacterium]|nr:DUF6763 family protein [Steroidobacteraceae bacterium]